jgi:enoyl-CoA hydratase/carnithine racemase
MNDFSNLETLSLIEREKKGYVDFKEISTIKDTLNNLQKLLDHIEDELSVTVLIFRKLEFLNFFPITIDEFRHWEKIFERITRLPCLTIGVIDGCCVGMGLQLAITCDFRLASTTSSLQSLEVKRGYLPGMMVFHLAKFVGLGIAKRILFVGLPYSAENAFKLGLIDLVFQTQNAKTLLDEFLESLLPIQPIAVQLTRRLLHESYADTYESSIGHFLAAQHHCFNSQRNLNNHDSFTL